MIKNAKFITSVASTDKFYKTDKPIVAIAGKSNVGKSSLINMLAGQKKLAKTSGSPGRTRLINYFDFGDFVLADLPGYGYAKVSKEEKLKWGNLLETFIKKEKLKLMIMLVDVRHNPTEDDKMMIDFLHHYLIPFSVVATKCDKLSKMQQKNCLLSIATELRQGIDDITATSAQTGLGKDKIVSIIEKAIAVKDLEIDEEI